jgi:hypothetical protein
MLEKTRLSSLEHGFAIQAYNSQTKKYFRPSTSKIGSIPNTKKTIRPGSAVSAVAFSPDSRLIISGPSDMTV